MQGGERKVVKPKLIEDYNKYMAGVDKLDQLVCSYKYPHKNRKWYMVPFHKIVEFALVNAYIMYMTDARKTGILPMTHKRFQQEVIEGLDAEHTKEPLTKGRRYSVMTVPARISECHFAGQFEDKHH